MLLSSYQRWLILAVVSTALFLIVVDMTVLYTALPGLTRDLGATASDKLWIVNTYALVVSGLLLGAGALGDRYGHSKTLACGMIVFAAASLYAAFSPSPAHLIAARALLGAGAALMMPSTLSIIRLTFEDRRERALAIGIWAAIAAGGAAIGPVLGGALLQFYWWRSVFLINVPIVIVAFIAALALVPPSPANRERRLDVLGSLQAMAGLIGLAYSVKALGKLHPSLLSASVSFTIGLVFTILFVRRQRNSAHPMLDFALFRAAGFTPAVFSAMVAGGALIGIELALSQRFQLVLGMSPLQAGLALLPLPLAAFVAGPIAGRLLPRIGAARLMPRALSMAGVGLGAYVMLLDAPAAWPTAALVLIGLGIGATITAASETIMHSAPPEHAGSAASVEEVSFELGGALGVTFVGSILSAIYSVSMAATPVGLEASESIDQALIVASDLSIPEGRVLLELAHASFDRGFVVSTAFAAVLLCITAAAIAWRTRCAPQAFAPQSDLR